MRVVLLSFTALVGAFHLGSGSALAQCSPGAVPDNGSVTCSGVDADGFETSSDGVTVQVNEGAEVSDRGVSADPFGLRAVLSFLGDAGTVENSGSIIATGVSTDGVSFIGGGTLTNRSTGVIEAADSPAVIAFGGLTLQNEGGTISASGSSHAISAGGTVSITNSGTISNTGDFRGAISTSRDSTFDIVNLASGVLSSLNDTAVSLSGTGSFVNFGIVTGGGSSDPGAISIFDSGVTVDNRGTIDGEVNFFADEAGDVLSNSGTITGDVVFFGDLGGTLNNTASIDGDVTFFGDTGAIITNSGTIAGVALTDEDGLLTNLGTINGVSAASGTVINEALIEADGTAVDVARRGSVTNSGTISSSGTRFNAYGVRFDTDATLINDGSIRSEGEAAVEVHSGSITNNAGGEIIGGDAGIEVRALFSGETDVDETSLSITNAGLIRGAGGIVVDELNTDRQFVTNSGTISGTDGIAMSLGANEDSLMLLGGGVVEGIVDFGADNDQLILEGVQSADVGMALGAALPLFDGGDGVDTVIFDPAVLISDLVSLSSSFDSALGFEVFLLSFMNADDTTSRMRVGRFEFLQFGDGIISLVDTAPIPVPPAIALFASGFGVLTLRRRTKRKS